MESIAQVIEQYDGFHDWYLSAVSTDMSEKVVELTLTFGKKKKRVSLLFSGATRILMNEFLIQNIIYSMDVLHDYQSDEFKRARVTLDKSYPWGKDGLPKPIVSINATIGADLLIEFDSLDVHPE
ncbi:hypothetical protein [Caballeronia insecticola]|uniref:hypothetical protein n=1 Tax=Caballeronia insecticola TaxID=758793 RepID=UPI0005C7350D|nr:hypothetical protein [Caballeronia insecticola]